MATISEEATEGENEFEDKYDLGKKLRAGSFGTVFETTKKGQPSDVLAVKIIDRKILRSTDSDAIFKEATILQELADVAGVVELLEFIVHPSKLYMVQQLARGGDVFERLVNVKPTYTEKDARDLAVTLVKTMKKVHEKKILHRDLKPENLLLLDANDDVSILVADFGFATHMREGGLSTKCGTPAFVAPEVVKGQKYNEAVDMWSVGCILYMLICGYPPFQAKDFSELFRKIRAGDYTFHDKYWKSVSTPAKQLISNLLTVNPQHRWTAVEAMESSWIEKLPRELDNDLSGALGEMKKYSARRRLKGAMFSVKFAASARFFTSDTVSFSKGNMPKVESSQPKTFLETYDLVRKIRKGSFATVWECQHKGFKDKFAVKVVKRKGKSANNDEAVMNEVSIMQSMAAHAEKIVGLTDFFEEPDYFFIVMEFMAGGDVFDRIEEKERYTEKDARDLVHVLLTAVHSLHQNGVAHRDIKPQNLLLESKDDSSKIKLCDFGFARRVHTPQSITHRVGTPTYVAPEVLKNIPHDERVDMWSVGVTIFVLLVGYAPFMANSQLELFAKIKAGRWSFNERDWKHISDDAKNLLKKLLVVDPHDRWTAEEALNCTWIKVSEDSLSQVDLGESFSSLHLSNSALRNNAKTVQFKQKASSSLSTSGGDDEFEVHRHSDEEDGDDEGPLPKASS